MAECAGRVFRLLHPLVDRVLDGCDRALDLVGSHLAVVEHVDEHLKDVDQLQVVARPDGRAVLLVLLHVLEDRRDELKRLLDLAGDVLLADEVVQQSQHQYWRKVPLKSTRGIIQDVRGNALVISETMPSFSVDPSILKSSDVIELSKLISGDLLAKVEAAMNTKNRFMWLNHKVSDNEAKGFKDLMSKTRAII